jgi:acyl-homoserine-lactone acylase
MNTIPLKRGLPIMSLGLMMALIAPAARAEPSPSPPEPVTILRDAWGMAHLYAGREEDGFYGLGYATAQDRLEQVLLLYRAAQGSLAAAFGPGRLDAATLAPGLEGGYADTVASDREVRRFRVLETARANFRKLPPQYQRDLTSYIAGLERYLTDHPERRPAWAPKLEAALPLAVFGQAIGEGQQICASRISAEDGAHRTPEPGGMKGSDAWVIGGSRTRDGGVIFSSDSHGEWNAVGTLFYPWRMKAGSLNVQAYEPTGTAMPFFGNSDRFAWGWTEAPRYSGDCYRVRTEAGAPRRYRFDGKVRRMTTRPYRIAIRGAAAESGAFEYTDHNGIESPVMARRGRDAFVVSYAYADQTGLGHAAMYRLSRAQDRKEMKAALAPMNLYPANLMIGGADGSLFYIRPGRIPKRPAGLDLTRLLDGNSAATAWTGFIPFAEALHLENPPQDYIVNDNTSPDTMYPEPVFRAPDYPAYYAFDPGQVTARQTRNIELLSDARGVDDAAAIRITMDEKVAGFEAWGAVFKTLAAKHAFAMSSSTFATFLTELETFDGVMARDSRSALYFDAFWDRLVANSGKELGDIATTALARRPLTLGQEALVVTAATEAHADLWKRFGRLDLTYGDVHRIGRGQEDYPVGGGGFLVNLEKSKLDTTGARVVGPEGAAAMRTMRFRTDAESPHLKRAICCQRVPFVVAFHPDGTLTSYSQALPGISQDPTSPHYDDQARLASEARLRPNAFYLDDLLKETTSRLELKRKP